jgi:Mg-chelatase subunit ChlD
MTWFRFVAAISLLFVPFASSMSAEREQFRIRSAFVGAAGEVSAVVELPPGSTPKSTDFKLLINDRVAATARETQDQRLNLMFLVDVSGSMKGPPLNDAKNALPSFLSKARPQDQFALTSFADEDRLRSSFADPREKINDDLRNLRVEGKRTKLYQALYNALKKGPKDDLRTRQIIVVVSDGKDEGSDVTLEQVITESKATLVPIYAVFRGEIERSFADVLAGLANAASGNFFSTRNRNEIATALEQIYRLETNSLAVRFVYQADPAGGATENAVIELRQPDGTARRAKFPEKLPAPFTAPTPSRFALWQIGLLLAVLLLSGGAVWIWGRSRRATVAPATSPIVEIETEPVITPPPPPPPHHATTVIAQYFPVPMAGQPTAMLRGVTGPVEGQQHAVDKEIYSIGASAANDLSIGDDEYISGEHAYLRYEKGSLFIFDKASRNGTFVNDDKVTQTGVVLRPGDRIKLGTCTFEVVMPSG